MRISFGHQAAAKLRKRDTLLIGINPATSPGCNHFTAHETWGHAWHRVWLHHWEYGLLLLLGTLVRMPRPPQFRKVPFPYGPSPEGSTLDNDLHRGRQPFHHFFWKIATGCAVIQMGWEGRSPKRDAI